MVPEFHLVDQAVNDRGRHPLVGAPQDVVHGANLAGGQGAPHVVGGGVQGRDDAARGLEAPGAAQGPQEVVVVRVVHHEVRQGTAQALLDGLHPPERWARGLGPWKRGERGLG